MKLIASLRFIQEHTTVTRIAHGRYRVIVNISNKLYSNITTYSPAYDRIRYDDYLPHCVKGSGGLTLIQAYHAILSDIQIIQLNYYFRNSSYII